MLLHESELTLLDRALAFGDVVKRSLTSTLSGTIISISTSVGLRHSFIDPSEPPENSGHVAGVLEEELVLANDWNEGDFVIYKNCWMGVVDEVFDDVAVRLENGSVVVVENPFGLEIPILNEEDEAAAQSVSSPINGVGGEAKGEPKPTGPAGRKTSRPKTVQAPTHLSPGQTVTTAKANLRRGRWLYGAYNASISATGVVVSVSTVKVVVNWLCQNMMVSGRFVPVERPDMSIEGDSEISRLKKFRKSTGGFVGIDGKPHAGTHGTGGGGELQVGDRVRFRDLESAVVKYQGGVRKIQRSETMGFEVNTFMVVETRTRVRVLWQDMTETIEEARALVPYLNVDEHEVWPGEMVVIKSEPEDDKVKPAEPETSNTGRQQFEGAWQFFNATLATPENAMPPPEFIKPAKVGVIQTANPAERVAKVMWFIEPKVEVAGNIMIPGSKTGPLGENVEDVSFYEIVAHQALGVRRGDFVLVAPERIVSEEPTGDATPSDDLNGTGHPPARQQLVANEGQWQQMAEGLRGMVDGGLLANLSAALGNSTHPQLQAVSRMLNQLPLISGAPQQASSPAELQNPQPLGEDAYLDQPLDWVGEIVDLGLDGLVTVRLGALDEPVDVKVPIERLHIIFNDEMEFDGLSEADEDAEYDSEESGSEDLEFDEDGDSEAAGWVDDDMVIEEHVYYQGGERLENDGGEEAWSTDEEVDDMDLEGDDDNSMPPLITFEGTDEDTEMSNSGKPEPQKAEQKAEVDEKDEKDEKDEEDENGMQPPPLPENMPAPEAFAIPTSSNQPPRFAILDSDVPTDQAFGSQPATPLDTAFLRRIHKEHKILSTSLPDGILVRSWESRMDLLRVLIIGPLNTPYELAPFVFDFHFSRTFPQTPPLAHFHSWTGGIGRVNPNLYEDGKICLSLLGTWHAERRNEGWSSGGSSVLQVLVSLMGLVLVREPYYSKLLPHTRFLFFLGVPGSGTDRESPSKICNC